MAAVRPETGQGAQHAPRSPFSFTPPSIRGGGIPTYLRAGKSSTIAELQISCLETRLRFQRVPGTPKYLSVDRLRVRRQDLPRRGTPELGSSVPGQEKLPADLLSPSSPSISYARVSRRTAGAPGPACLVPTYTARLPPNRAQLGPVKGQGKATEIPDMAAGLPWVRGVER